MPFSFLLRKGLDQRPELRSIRGSGLSRRSPETRAPCPAWLNIFQLVLLCSASSKEVCVTVYYSVEIDRSTQLNRVIHT